MRVWVTGAAGMLGQEVVAALTESGYNVVATDREVDITDARAVSGFWDNQGVIEWVVNCAAWTAVDAAEEHEPDAAQLNVVGPRVLAEAAGEHGAAIVHISTDYVFSGSANRPYRPEDPPDPQSAYGCTKRDGEEAVRQALARHIILRTAWLFGAGGKNFVYTMLRLMNERDTIGVVGDQYGLPTYAPDLAQVITSAIAATENADSWGTYHYTNAGTGSEGETGISWFDFAQEIQRRGGQDELLGSQCTIGALTTAEYPTPAARPAYSVLDCSSTVEILGARRPDWRDALQRFLTEMNSQQRDTQ